MYSCVIHICIICRGELNEEKSQKHTHGWLFLSLFSEETRDGTHTHAHARMHTHTHTEYKNNTEHLKTKFFIYFVTTSYTSPESFHSDRTVTQDKSIWHIAINAKTSIESSDSYCFPF